MKKPSNSAFIIVALLIFVFTTVAFTGISTTYADITTIHIKGANEIRWGIDIRGGVDVTFTPSEGYTPTSEQMEAAGEVMRQRLLSQNITDYEVYVDTSNSRVIVRFPWNQSDTEFDPEKAIAELGEIAVLTFREGNETTLDGLPTGTTENIILEGEHIKKASAQYGSASSTGYNEYYVQLDLTTEGASLFAEATSRLAGVGTISIWMDDIIISNPSVNTAITDGSAIITGGFDSASAESLADKINGGSLPFKMETETYSTITPTLGEGARDAMVLSGLIAFILVCAYIIAVYKLPGLVASIALVGQVGGTIAALTGFVDGIDSFTLTIPGIAGIILAVGMGVDANVITAERIKEELRGGRSIDGSIKLGYERGFSAIFDGNVTMILIAIVLMGAFGDPNSLFATLLSPIFFMFPTATQGVIYSFGYTLTVGVILNFLFGVTASRVMLKSISKCKTFRKAEFYGGTKNVEK